SLMPLLSRWRKLGWLIAFPAWILSNVTLSIERQSATITVLWDAGGPAMNDASEWIDVGAAAELQAQMAVKPVQPITVANRRLALSFKDGVFGAVDGVCNHAGGPLAEGSLIDDFISCP